MYDNQITSKNNKQPNYSIKRRVNHLVIVKSILVLSAIVIMIRFVPWHPFELLKLKFSGISVPRNERFSCEVDSDCMISCEYGATNKEWYYANPPKIGCFGGCDAPLITGGRPKARCMAGRCIAFIGNRINRSCTGKNLILGK